MITTKEMKFLEENCGISKLALMENAGKGIAKILKEKFDLKNKRILIVAYHGNNGGDGFVAARHLCSDTEVDILFVGEEGKLKSEALSNFRRIENNKKLQMLTLEAVDFSDYDIIVDAIFGTGFSEQLPVETGKHLYYRPPHKPAIIKDPLATIIKNLSKARTYKVSVDVPSGINPDTGEKANVFFEPDLIITMHDVKKGLEGYRDKTVVVDIGIKRLEK